MYTSLVHVLLQLEVFAICGRDTLKLTSNQGWDRLQMHDYDCDYDYTMINLNVMIMIMSENE